MTHLCLVEPTTLLAVEVRKLLEERDLGIREVSALSGDEDSVGTLLDLAGSAVRTEPLSDGALARADLVILAHDTFRSAAEVLARLEGADERPHVLLLAPDTPVEAGPSFVEEVNLERTAGPVMVSPHPAVILLARLGAALADLAPRSIDATVLQPASIVGQDGMHEVFAQSRALLSMEGQLPKDTFHEQVAFSTAPARLGGTDEDHRGRLQELLGGAVDLGVQTLQTGSFHGLGLSVAVRFTEPPPEDELEKVLSSLAPIWQVVEAPGAATAGSADADSVSVTARRDPSSPLVWLWITADNLAHASAPNAVAVVEAWLSRRQPDDVAQA